jgi:hypothetical protein
MSISDCSSIIKAFQKKMLTAPSEAAISGATMLRVSSIQSNSRAASSSLQNAIQPPIPSELISAGFSNSSSGSDSAASANVSLSLGQAFSNVQSRELRGLQEFLADCIPCDLRVEFRAELVSKLDDAFLDMLEEMINNYLKELSFLVNLLNATDVYADVCPLLFILQDICIPDLQRLLSLLASILYRMTVRELTSLDLMKILILPLFQPLFNSLFGMLNQYKALITDPLQCVLANMDTQLNKLKIGEVMSDRLITDIVLKADKLKLLETDDDKAKLISTLDAARQPFQDLDAGINAMQNASGSAVMHLRRLSLVGIFEIETLLKELKAELANFLGFNQAETVEFMLNQYQKMLIFRLISFIAALVKAKTVGFNCDFTDQTKAEDTVGRFLSDFLGPNAPVIVTNNTVTGDIQLIFNPDNKRNLPDLFPDQQAEVVVQVGFPRKTLRASGSPEVDSAINAIINQSNQPVTIKPGCVFEPGLVDSNQLAKWIRDLEEST